MKLNRTTSRITFLSTLSLRRATCYYNTRIEECFYFYPRSPCGERPTPVGIGDGAGGISIHALLAESDYLTAYLGDMELAISIHALLAESDSANCSCHNALPDFYPRSPCGERPKFLTIHREQQIISIHALLAESDLASVISILSR